MIRLHLLHPQIAVFQALNISTRYTKASEEVASLPQAEIDQVTGEIGKDTSIVNEEDSIKTIIKEASHSPKTALILLASEVEKEARQTLASIGKLKGARKLTLSQIINELDSHYGLPKHVASSLRMFWDTRNKIIHGGETEVGTRRAIAAGELS